MSGHNTTWTETGSEAMWLKVLQDMIKARTAGVPVAPQAAPVGLMSAAELLDRMERGDAPVIVDVRQPEEWAAGHIPGALHIPLGDMPRRMGELNRDAETVLVCRSGNRSGRAAAFLAQQGFTRVYNLQGGMLRWSGPVS